MNANAEALRGFFVTHEGQKVLTLVYGESNTRFTLDYNMVAGKFSALLRKEVNNSLYPMDQDF